MSSITELSDSNQLHHTHVTLYVSSIWFWVKEPAWGVGRHVVFDLSRDSVYGATMLLGMGGATVLVLAMAMISHLVGEFTVSVYEYIYM